MNISNKHISEFLGGQKVVGLQTELNQLVKEVLPKQALDMFIHKSKLNETILFSYLDITKQALKSYKPPEKLRLYISDRLIHLAELYVKGSELFNSIGSFNVWLNRPSIDLAGRKPIVLIKTSKGVDELLQLLGRIEHGILV